MGKTISEKILSNYSGKDACAGDIVVCNISFILGGHEANASLTIDVFEELTAKSDDKLFDSSKIIFLLDHVVPSQNESYSRLQQITKEFAEKHNTRFRDVGYGICHHVLPEDRLVHPGELVIGADSHTCTYGALNVFATGMGSTDIAVAMKTGQTWFKVPETTKIIINGDLQKGTSSKDIILYLIGKFTSNGFNYQTIEFHGSTIQNCSIEQRLTISNMVVEMGAKAGLMEYDEKLAEWFKHEDSNRYDFTPEYSDEDAVFKQIIEVNAEEVVPQVAFGHSLDNVAPVDNFKDVRINQAVLGTCTNGRLEDLKIAAKILKGKKIHENVRMLVYPASRKVLLQACKMGILEDLIEAGALIAPPGCGPCAGLYGGIPYDGENVISSSNRNFRGRMGNKNANIYIASSETVAVSALTGYITNPADFLR